MRHRPVLLTALGSAALLVMGLGACASETASDGELSFVTIPKQNGGFDAQVAGTIVDTHGCLTLRNDDSGETLVPVFESSSGLPGELRDGEKVELSGGGLSELPEGSNVPSECEGIDAFSWAVPE